MAVWPWESPSPNVPRAGSVLSAATATSVSSGSPPSEATDTASLSGSAHASGTVTATSNVKARFLWSSVRPEPPSAGSTSLDRDSVAVGTLATSTTGAPPTASPIWAPDSRGLATLRAPSSHARTMGAAGAA